MMDNQGYQRLVEMARQSGMKGFNEKYLSPAELEFAQRIVTDCAGIVYNNLDDNDDAVRVSGLILNAFGVK